MLTILNRIARLPPWVIIASAVVINVVVALVDFVSGYELAFAVFYLAGVVLTTWLLGSRWGLILATISVGLWLATDLLGGREYSQPWIPFWNALVRFGFFVMSSQGMAALHAALERAEFLARIDPLTNVANRRAFLEAATREIDRARRYGNCLTLVFLDLDNFKVVNDTHGHAAGDQLLRTLAETMRTMLRQSDILGRLGGDEFGVLLPQSTYSQAAVAIERIQQTLLAEMRQNGLPITVSIGAITWAVPPEDIDQLIHQADVLMYSVKHTGKDAIRHEEVGAQISDADHTDSRSVPDKLNG